MELAVVLVSEAIRARSAGLGRAALQRFATRARRAAGVHGQAAVLLTSDAQVRRLNRDFRGKDQTTDVLSFPAEAHGQAGDIVISVPRARAQAREHGHSLREEIEILMLHGMLHLAGMDHERDRGQMRRREEKLRQRLGLPAGVITRAQRQPRAQGKVRSSAR